MAINTLDPATSKIQATNSTQWMGEFSLQRVDGGQQVDGVPLAFPEYTWTREERYLVRHRFLKGILTSDGSQVDQLNDTATGDQLKIANGDDVITSSAALTWKCIAQNLVPDPPSSGIWREDQVWFYAGDWEETLVEVTYSF